MIARLTVQRGDLTEYPLAERTKGGWQNGVTFYPDADVTKVTALTVEAAHDAQCEAEYVVGAAAYTDCGCDDRTNPLLDRLRAAEAELTGALAGASILREQVATAHAEMERMTTKKREQSKAINGYFRALEGCKSSLRSEQYRREAAEARAAEAERERDNYALAIKALEDLDDENAPLERRSLYAFMENNSSLPAVVARVKAEAWAEGQRSVVWAVTDDPRYPSTVTYSDNPYRAGADQSPIIHRGEGPCDCWACSTDEDEGTEHDQ